MSGYRAALVLLLVTAVAGAAGANEPPDARTLADRARGHWAFRPLRRPPLPPPAVPAPTPVDAFLRARLQAEGLATNPPADRLTLLRRATLTLTGLPPTPDEQAAFLADERPDAFRRQVDRLLASPAFGERMARHWLDVARYADTNGYERDGDKPSAWRYRDWVIGAMNADLPYDRFVREQVAGDEVPGSGASEQTATTFLRLGTWDDEPANELADRYDQLDDVLGVTASAFLAQTVRCARCHDHKFEPVSQADYYRLLAVFEPLRRPQKDRTEFDRPVGAPQAVAAHEAAVRARREEGERLAGAVSSALAPARARVLLSDDLPAGARRALRLPESARGAADQRLAAQHQKQLDALAEKALTPDERPAVLAARQAQQAHAARPVPELPRAYIWQEEGPRAPVTHVLRRGNPNLAGAEVGPGVPAVLGPGPALPPRPGERTTGRRLWLADWLAARDNPLTARVMVNRLWAWHFGRGLVATPNDFGLAGEAPSHPELLDWLAAELIDSGWSLKHVHRLILNSEAFQASSALPARGDPARALSLYARWRPRRLEGEVIRDSVLAVAGSLNRQAGGPGVYPPLPQAVLAGQSRPGQGWGKSPPEQAARRSVYVFAKRSLALPELELLDAPDSTSSCEQRGVSTTAPQALTLFNGQFFHDQAARFADRLREEAGPDPGALVRRAYALALGRPPRPAELARGVAFLEGEADGRAALAAFCLVLFNCNEFAYPG